MNEYEKQANEFLKETGSKLKIKFLENGKHFDDDKQPRDIYQVSFSRGGRSFMFNFGRSIAESTKIKRTHSKEKFSLGGICLDNPKRKLHPEVIKRITDMKVRKSQSNSSFFGNNDGLYLEKGTLPSSYDILACLTCYHPGTFDDFCSEFGYDVDSRTAEKTYSAVLKEYTNLCTLFNAEELEKLSEIS